MPFLSHAKCVQTQPHSRLLGNKKKNPTSGLSAEAAKTKLLKSLCFHSCHPPSPGSFHHMPSDGAQPACSSAARAPRPKGHPPGGGLAPTWPPPGHTMPLAPPEAKQAQDEWPGQGKAQLAAGRAAAAHRQQRHGWFLCGVPAPALERKNRVWPCNLYICASGHASQGCF